jgi:hypothetical protein
MNTELDAAQAEWEEILAGERLAGNIVKEEHAKGVLMGLAICRQEAERLTKERDDYRLALVKAENAIQKVVSITDENRLGWALKEIDRVLCQHAGRNL